MQNNRHRCKIKVRMFPFNILWRFGVMEEYAWGGGKRFPPSTVRLGLETDHYCSACKLFWYGLICGFSMAGAMFNPTWHKLVLNRQPCGRGYEDLHHNFVVIGSMIMKFGTGIKIDVFFTLVAKTCQAFTPFFDCAIIVTSYTSIRFYFQKQCRFTIWFDILLILMDPSHNFLLETAFKW